VAGASAPGPRRLRRAAPFEAGRELALPLAAWHQAHCQAASGKGGTLPAAVPDGHPGCI